MTINNVNALDAALAAAKAAKVNGNSTEEEREARKLLFETARRQKVEERVTKKLPKNNAKQLPQLNEFTNSLFETLTALDNNDLTALVAHVNVVMKSRAVSQSREIPLIKGQEVKIVSGTASLIGQVGTIVDVRRVRIFVDIGKNKPAYLYRNDVVPIDNEPQTESENVIVQNEPENKFNEETKVGFEDESNEEFNEESEEESEDEIDNDSEDESDNKSDEEE